MSDKLEIELKEVEVSKLNLQLGDVLTVTIKADMPQYDLERLSEGFKRLFPNNKVAVLLISPENEIEFSVTSQPTALGCDTQNYCSDCNCGKKEQAENK